MDSLLANYASSDDEAEEQEPRDGRDQQRGPSLPQPSSKSTSNPPDSASKTPLFSPLPQPNSSIFSSLPPPTSNSQTLTDPPSSIPKPKRVVQFKPPIPEYVLKSRYEEEEEEGDEERERKRRNQSVAQTPSVRSWLSAIPAPKHSRTPLGAISSSGSGRRSIVEVGEPVADTNSETCVNPTLRNSKEEDDEDEERERKGRNQSVAQTPSVRSWLPAPKHSWTSLGAVPSSGSGRRSIIEVGEPVADTNSETSVDPTLGNSEGNWADGSSSAYQTVENFPSNWVAGSSSDSLEQSSSWSGGAEGQQVYEDYGSYGDYGGGYGHYENNWGDGSTAALHEVAGTDNAVRFLGKRGKNEVPAEIVEVKQDELIKNRPREDQVKLTGIAFGPSSYLPASTKGKPSKLHKRKHQIGSLYFDMKQKEMELAERRAKGFLTKAETQAKYGW